VKHLLLVVFLLLATGADLWAADPTVMVVESYHAEYAWDQSYLNGLREGLGAKVKLVRFQMDTKRVPKSMYQQQADLAWQKFLEVKPDLIVLGDDNALKYLGPKLLDKGTPVVYLGINNNPEDYVPGGHNITGILERPLYNFSIRTVGQIVQPKPKKILVLFDHGTTSQASVAEAFQGKKRVIMHDIEVDLQTIGNWDLWQAEVLGAKDLGYDALVVGLYHTLSDSHGHNVPADRVMQWTSANTPVPPFGFWDFSVGAGKTIGGFVLSGREQGLAAAKVARGIIEGAEPASIPPKIGEKGAFVFSRSELKRYGFSLPAEMARRTNWVE